MAIEPSQHWRSSVACPKCRYYLRPLDEILPRYFSNGTASCWQCQADVDVWAALIEEVKDVFATWSLRALGAFETNFRFQIRAGEWKPMDYTAYGVPEEAVLLAVNYTPMGGCLPVEIHGNIPSQRSNRKQVGLTAVAFPDAVEPTGEVSAAVFWVLERDNSEPWLLLAEALAAAAAGDYLRVITPAHAAFEIALSRLVKDVFETAASKTAVQHFLQNDVTSSSATNVLLPLFCRLAGVPMLKNEIRGRVTRLRSLRNALVHTGLNAAQIEAREIREALVAVVVAFEFVRFLRPQVLASFPRTA